jgi:hypothetical protein
MLVFLHCIKIVYRLSTLHNDSAWNPSIVKDSVDLVRILEQAASAVELANAAFKAQTGEDSVLAVAAETMRATAPNWRVPEPSVNVRDLAAASGWGAAVDGLDTSMLDFPEDFWLSDVFNF